MVILVTFLWGVFCNYLVNYGVGAVGLKCFFLFCLIKNCQALAVLLFMVLISSEKCCQRKYKESKINSGKGKKYYCYILYCICKIVM